MGLHVGPAGTVELLGALDGDGFALVHNLAAAVVAFAGIAFGIFVGHHGAHGFHDLVAYKIFRRDKLNALGLTFSLFLDEIENCGISLHINYVLNE